MTVGARSQFCGRRRLGGSHTPSLAGRFFGGGRTSGETEVSAPWRRCPSQVEILGGAELLLLLDPLLPVPRVDPPNFPESAGVHIGTRGGALRADGLVVVLPVVVRLVAATAASCRVGFSMILYAVLPKDLE